MSRYQSDAANEVAKRFAKPAESPRVAAARRLIANASPGNREAVAASVIGDARDMDEIKVLHAVATEETEKAAQAEPVDPYQVTGEPPAVPYGGFQAVPPAGRTAATAGETAYDEFLDRAHHENGHITDEDRRAAGALADRIDEGNG